MISLAGQLQSFNADLFPDKVQLTMRRWQQMLLPFFRGTCSIFYEELAAAKSNYKSYLKAYQGGLL
jgi:hypothetical protein